jgi:hypothetical protein
MLFTAALADMFIYFVADIFQCHAALVLQTALEFVQGSHRHRPAVESTEEDLDEPSPGRQWWQPFERKTASQTGPGPTPTPQLEEHELLALLLQPALLGSMLAAICYCTVPLYRTVLDATAAAVPVAKAAGVLRIDTAASKGRRSSLQSPTRRNSDEKDAPAAALAPARAAAPNYGAAAAELDVAHAEDLTGPAADAAAGIAFAAEAAVAQSDAAAAAPQVPEELLKVDAPQADVGNDVAAVQELKPAISSAAAAHLCDTAAPSPSAAVAAATGLGAHFSGPDSSSLGAPAPATTAAATAVPEPDLVDTATEEHGEADDAGNRERADSTSSNESDVPPAVPKATSASLELLTARSVNLRRPSHLASLVGRLEAERRQPTALRNTTFWRDVGEESGSDVSSCNSPGSAQEENVPVTEPNTSRRTAVAADSAVAAAEAVEKPRRGLLSPEQVAAVMPAKQGDPGLAAVRTLYDLQDDFESEIGKLCSVREAAEKAALPLLRERAILALLSQRLVLEDAEQREAQSAADAQYIAADLAYQQEQLSAAQRHLRAVASADAKQYWSAVKAKILAAHSGDELLALPVLEGAHRAALTALHRNTDGYAMYYGELQSYARYSSWLSVAHVKATSFDVLKRSLYMPEFSNDAGQFIMLAMPPGRLW